MAEDAQTDRLQMAQPDCLTQDSVPSPLAEPASEAESGSIINRAWTYFDGLWHRSRTVRVLTRALSGVYHDGFIHAGNLAYLSLLSLFPFFIVMTAFATLFGQSDEGIVMINNVLIALPRNVVEAITPAIHEMLQVRTGSLLWLGALVGLWSVGSLIETIRDIMSRAYGTTSGRPFWQNRLSSIAMTIGGVVLLFVSLFLTVMLTGLQHAVEALPRLGDKIENFVTYSKIIPAFVLYGSIYGLFRALTPRAFKGRQYPKWPGALFTTLWWIFITAALPSVISSATSYDLTYGSLAGFVIALLFFWLVGFGLVFGIELNAAIADVLVDENDLIGQSGDGNQSTRNGKDDT